MRLMMLRISVFSCNEDLDKLVAFVNHVNKETDNTGYCMPYSISKDIKDRMPKVPYQRDDMPVAVGVFLGDIDSLMRVMMHIQTSRFEARVDQLTGCKVEEWTRKDIKKQFDSEN